MKIIFFSPDTPTEQEKPANNEESMETSENTGEKEQSENNAATE